MSWQQLASEFSACWQQSWCSAGVEVLQLRGRKEEAGPGAWPTISLVISPTSPHLQSTFTLPTSLVSDWRLGLLSPLPPPPACPTTWVVMVSLDQSDAHIVRSTCGKDSLQSVPTSDMKVLYLFPLRGPCCALAIFSPPSCRVIFKYEGCPLLRLSCPAINRYLPESLVLAQRWRDCGNKKVPLSSKPGIPIHIHPADVSMRNITRGTTGSNIEGLNQSTPMTAFTHSSYQSQLCTFFRASVLFSREKAKVERIFQS